MTPAEFDKLRTQWLAADGALYDAVFCVKDGELPGDPVAYWQRVKDAHNASARVLAALQRLDPGARV